MFPHFFRHKFKEVAAFLKIMRGKATHDDDLRIAGVNDALKNVENERSVYESERDEATRGEDGDTGRKKYVDDSDQYGRDISAI